MIARVSPCSMFCECPLTAIIVNATLQSCICLRDACSMRTTCKPLLSPNQTWMCSTSHSAYNARMTMATMVCLLRSRRLLCSVHKASLRYAGSVQAVSRGCAGGVQGWGRPAGEVCLSEMGATAEASLEPMAMPTSAVARAAKSLMPSPQYMQVLPRPCMAPSILDATLCEAGNIQVNPGVECNVHICEACSI